MPKIQVLAICFLSKTAAIIFTFFEKDTNPHSQLKIANKFSAKLQELMILCLKNLYHAQKLQKQAYEKDVKLKSYVLGDKVWLNSKYLKTK